MSHETLTPNETMLQEKLAPIVKRRLRVSGYLTAFLLGLYAFFAYLLSTGEEVAGVPVSGELNLVVMTAIFAIVSGVVVSGYYSWWTKKNLDPVMEEIRELVTNE
ncbi:hypothetical protein GCM10017044_10650 [Kordiimonas sediminis]|uniref:DUF485 domain-containing protein n=1 Tax=Kordiimonas sediminis TaxID=1735581 RepID=A0A919APK2_9PROT|nr:DUF485 domain-containing protein [Kordiimonas sediminis]GHF18016.1 hypothetical protein GCM10017044_10650 [Kordiimonas sediminis]